MKEKQQKEKQKEKMAPEERVWNEWNFHSTVWHFSTKAAIPGKLGYTSIPTLAEKLILKYMPHGSRILCFDDSMAPILAHGEDLTNRFFSYADFHEFTATAKEVNVGNDRKNVNTMNFDGIFATAPWWILTENNQSVRQVHEAVEPFLSRTKILLSKCFQILQPNGFFILNTKDVIADHIIPLGSLLMQQSLDAGFNLWDVIHFDFKDKKSLSSTFSSFDYLLILQKRNKGWKYLHPANFLQKDSRQSQTAPNYATRQEKHNCEVWNFNVGAESRTLTHGFEYHSEERYIKSKRKIYEKTLFAGKLVPQLVRKLILEYSQPNNTVFDLFVGTGTVILEGIHCGRKSLGIDINPAAVELARRKVSAYLDSKKDSETPPTWSVETGNAIEGVPLPGKSIDLIFAHPPYWGLVKYTDFAEDLSNMRLKEYLQAVQKIFREAFRLLKPQGHLIAIIGDKRKSGLVPLGSYLVLLGLHNGFWLWDLILNDTEFGGKQHDYFAQIKSKKYKFHLTDHDYILIFKKGGASSPTRELWLPAILTAIS
ncbi:MAG: DNA methyltransferase [Candidatus Hodarchaeales archaeon]|jgi:DNA modification methylase